MEQLSIRVKGSSADPYETIFIKDGESLTALCDCPAGSFNNVCKHRVNILDGDTSAVLEEDTAKVQQVVEWLVGTDVEAALRELRDIEARKDVPKEEVVTAKRKLARAMNS